MEKGKGSMKKRRGGKNEGNYYQKNPFSHALHAEPTFFKPEDYIAKNPLERKQMAHSDAKQHAAFYRELIKENIYPEGTKVKVKKEKHSNAYILEFWMPELSKTLYEELGRLDSAWFPKKKKARATSLVREMYAKSEKAKEVAERMGYGVNFAEPDSNYASKLKQSTSYRWSEDLERSNNWALDDNGKVKYIDVHVLNSRLPFKGRKKRAEEELYSKFVNQESVLGLEGKTLAFGFIGLLGLTYGLIYSPLNITGNVVGVNYFSSWTGILVFVLGVIGVGLFFRKK